MQTETEPTTGEITRRDVLACMGTGLVVLTIGGPWEAMSPAEARARSAAAPPHGTGQILFPAQVGGKEALILATP
jgi:hypothetical protein